MTTDPFAGGESRPALSFRDAPTGTSFTGRVLEAPALVQSRDFETGEPAFWPDGNRKMSAVIALDVNGEERSLWAAKPSAMFKAIGDAQKAAGQQIAVGGTLTVTLIGETPNAKNPRLNPQKLYAATYSGPDAFAGAMAGGAGDTAASASSVQQSSQQRPPSSPPSGGPTPEQLAAVRAAGLDPATVFPGFSDQPPF